MPRGNGGGRARKGGGRGAGPPGWGRRPRGLKLRRAASGRSERDGAGCEVGDGAGEREPAPAGWLGGRPSAAQHRIQHGGEADSEGHLRLPQGALLRGHPRTQDRQGARSPPPSCAWGGGRGPGAELCRAVSPQGGSAGKGTALRNNSDADVVLFVNCFSSYQQQEEERGRILAIIERRLCECPPASSSVRISTPCYKDSRDRPRSLSLTLSSYTSGESIDVDILPAYDVLGRMGHGVGWGLRVGDICWAVGCRTGLKVPLTFTGQVIEDARPDPEVYVKLLATCCGPGDFSPSFTELQKNFVKWRPAKLKDLVRLVKHWYKQVSGVTWLLCAPTGSSEPHQLPTRVPPGAEAAVPQC